MSDAPRTVLVADDDEDILQLVVVPPRTRRLHGGHGRRRGAGARRLRVNISPDLAVLDVMMPS